MKQQGTVAFYGFRGGRGGLSHVMLNLMNEMAGQGLNVHILLNNPEIPELKQLHPAVKKVLLGDAGGPGRIFSLAAWLKERGPDVLFSNREPANRTSVIAKMISGSRTKVAFRVGMPMKRALQRRNLVKRWLRQSYIRFSYNRADVIIANAKGVAEDIAVVTGLPLTRINVLPNPTVSRLLFEKAGEDIDHPWLERGQPPVIMGVGRLARQKDFPTLIKAFSMVKKQTQTRLMILGEGKERAALQDLIDSLGLTDSVELYGYCPNPFALLKRAALFVLSSAWEGLPNVLIEAMALGVPVVATDCRSGPAEILDKGRYGRLVPVGNAEEMAGAILAALSDPPAREVLQRAAGRYEASRCTLAYIKALGLGGGDWSSK